MTIFTAFVNVLKSVFALIRIIVTETARAIKSFYKGHPVIAAYLTGFVAVCLTAVIAYNYGANGGKSPFDAISSFTETTTTAQDENIETTIETGEPKAQTNSTTDTGEPKAQPLVSTVDDSSDNVSNTPVPQSNNDSHAAGEVRELKGIDVSQHNPPTAWNSKIDEIDFVIVKISEGYTYTDPKMAENLQAAKEANKLIGAYHLVRPDSGIDAATEAAFFVKTLKEAGWDHNWLLACDFEPQFSIKKDGKIDYAANANFCNAFLDEVARLTDGVKPLMYACAKDINNGGDNWKGVAKSYGLWMAGYPQNPQTTDSGNFIDSQEKMPYEIGPWNYLTIWQYSSANHLDKNVAYMSAEAWGKFANPTVS